MEQKLHTPEGVRDIYNRECAIKLALQKKLNTVLHLYGYQDIQTPTFEYFDVFRKEIGSTSIRDLYKFFDREGNILFSHHLIEKTFWRFIEILCKEFIHALSCLIFLDADLSHRLFLFTLIYSE